MDFILRVDSLEELVVIHTETETSLQRHPLFFSPWISNGSLCVFCSHVSCSLGHI